MPPKNNRKNESPLGSKIDKPKRQKLQSKGSIDLVASIPPEVPPLRAQKTEGYPLGRYYAGILLFLLGLYYLGINFNFIPLEYRIPLINFWPLLLIFLGLSMIKVKSILSGILLSIVVLLIFASLAVRIWNEPRQYYKPFSTDNSREVHELLYEF